MTDEQFEVLIEHLAAIQGSLRELTDCIILEEVKAHDESSKPETISTICVTVS